MSDEIKKSITIFKTPSWGILGTAFLIMLVCKCGGWCPDLSWWIVTAPFWGPLAICVAFFVGFYVIAFAAFLIVIAVGLASVTIEAIVGAIENLFKRKK